MSASVGASGEHAVNTQRTSHAGAPVRADGGRGRGASMGREDGVESVKKSVFSVIARVGSRGVAGGVLAVGLWLGGAGGGGVARGMTWYEAAGALAAGPAASGGAGSGSAAPSEGGGSGRGGSGWIGGEVQRTEAASARAEAAKFRSTMDAVVAEYDRIGAGALARQCLDASRIVEIAENPSGWREIVFLAAGLVSLLAALFITKLLGSMFKVEIAQLLWIPIAGCLALLAGLFMAVRAAKKRKAAVVAGVALSAAGVVSLVDPVRHAVFGVVADVFVAFTAWYVPLAAAALGMAGVLFVFFLLLRHMGEWAGAVGAFVLRNALGLALIPGVCAVLFLAILSVVGPWFEGRAGELASAWTEDVVRQQAGAGGGAAGGAAVLESLRELVAGEEREGGWASGEVQVHAWESGTWSGGVGGAAAGAAAQEAGGGSGWGGGAGVGGTVPFAAYPKEVRRAAAEMARAAEGVYEGRLPRGAEAFEGFLAHAALEGVSAHGWDRGTAVFSTEAGLVAQVYRRRTDWKGGRETVVVFRGTAGAKDGVEDWRQLFGGGNSPQYAEAAALVRAVRETVEGPVVVAGHSLGGGQAQYALAMNAGAGGMRGVGFNPAGLSAPSVAAAEERMGGSAVAAAAGYAAVRLESDPVSTAGIFLGRVVVVPANGVRGMAAHSIAVLAREMERNAE